MFCIHCMQTHTTEETLQQVKTTNTLVVIYMYMYMVVHVYIYA